MQQAKSEVAVPSWSAEGLDIDAGGALVSVEGVVWVTSTIDGRDVILSPGDKVDFAKQGRAVVGGLGGKSVKVRVEGPESH